MKITIELTRSQIILLGNWASLSRTFDCFRRVIDGARSSTGPDTTMTDDIEQAEEELNSIHAPLSSLHMDIRAEIWKQWNPEQERIFAAYKAKTMPFDEAVKELEKLGVWQFKAKQWLRELAN